jgi:NAD(P)-dependent dehydrogenase (short-subunit alcohol dehydrogenase family)
MPEPRTVVLTGASRGLGLATAAHLHRAGWRVVAAMRSPDEGLAAIRRATATTDDTRLIGVRLDLEDRASIADAARAIEEAVGAPDGVVHNAGLAAVGCLEELPPRVWEQVFATNFFGPVLLTRAILPRMRAAGRGRIVMVSSQGAIRGMPAIGAYSASKGALERWAESLSMEIAPFGLGVTVLVAGTFKTDILELTRTYADMDGPYAAHHLGLEHSGRRFTRLARPPARFAPAVAKALDDQHPFVRRTVGVDARLLLLGQRVLPARVLARIVGRAIGLPAPGALHDDARRLASVTPDLDERESCG